MAVLKRLPMSLAIAIVMVMGSWMAVVSLASSDTNHVFIPCLDTTVQKSDGFTFGIVFAPREKFFLNHTFQLSPCDSRLSLASNSQIALFRTKVDEISLLTINSSSSSPDGYMVAFAGRKYAARSTPAFAANNSYTVTSFTLALEFQKGRLQNFYWKKDGCAKCSGNNKFTCINNQDCAIKTSQCKSHGGPVDCSIGIQVAFSGTDKHLSALNSWYEVKRLRQYSLYGLYSNLRDSLTSEYNKIF